MKKILLCLLGILCIITENSITNYIDILNISINLTLIYMTIVALYLDELDAGILGALLGILKDIMIGGVFGVNALILFIIGYGISYIKKNLYKESYITIFALVLISALVDSVINIATFSLIYKNYNVLVLGLRGILLIPLINSLASLVIYRLFKKSILKLKED